ncbi:MAG: class III signal peptide-containing protein [archaeon]|jgi:hypothetical protein
MNLKTKGQGAIEYLLIIGGAILVAVIVVSIIISMSSKSTDNTSKQNEKYENFLDNTIISPIILAVDCSTTAVTFTINLSPTDGVTEYCVTKEGIPDLSNCRPKANTLVYTNSMNAGTKYNYSLIAKKTAPTVAYSQPSAPSSNCTAHN